MANSAISNGRNGVINGMPSQGGGARLRRTTPMKDIEAFIEMTGDRDPIHYDGAFAERSVFGKLIAQGGVASRGFNALVAEDPPRPPMAFLACDWKFLTAIGVNEEIIGSVEILTVRRDEPICTLNTQLRNAAGELRIDGVVTTYTVRLAGEEEGE